MISEIGQRYITNIVRVCLYKCIEPVHVGFDCALLVFVARAGLAVGVLARFVDFPKHITALFRFGFDLLDALPVKSPTRICRRERHH